MQFKCVNQNNSYCVRVHLEHGERIQAAVSALAALSGKLTVAPSEDGTAMKNIFRMFSGDTMYYQYVLANKGPGDIILVSQKPGLIMPINLDGTYNLRVLRSAFVAATESIEIKTKINKVVKDSVQLIGLSGKGTVFLGAYGGVEVKTLAANEEYCVVENHVLGWTTSMKTKYETARNGLLNGFSGTPASVLRFTGPGTVLIQTRSESSLQFWMKDLGYDVNEVIKDMVDKKIEAALVPLKSSIQELNGKALAAASVDKDASILETPEAKAKKKYEVLNPATRQDLCKQVEKLSTLSYSEQAKVIRELESKGIDTDMIDYVRSSVLHS